MKFSVLVIYSIVQHRIAFEMLMLYCGPVCDWTKNRNFNSI